MAVKTNGRNMVIALALILIAAGALFGVFIIKVTPASALPASSSPDATPAPAWHNIFPDYLGIKMISPASGWIVGAEGTIRNYDGSHWLDYLSPVTTTLRAVDASATEAWAVGDNDTTLHYAGTTWQVVSSPAPLTTTLTDVKIGAPGEAWAISGVMPILMHYAAGSWTVVTDPVFSSTVAFHQLSWTSPTDGWIVGDEGTAVVYHYHNGLWTKQALPYPDALSIYMLDASEGWIGLDGDNSDFNSPAVLHYSAGVWSPIAAPVQLSPCPGQYLNYPRTQVRSMVGFAGSHLYAAGDYDWVFTTHGQCGIVTDKFFYHDGIGAYSGYTDTVSLSGLAANDIWAVGPQSAIYHWDGANLTPISERLDYASKVEMTSVTEAWVYGVTQLYTGEGIGGAFHYADGVLSILSPNGEAEPDLGAFAFASPNNGWGWGVSGPQLNQDTFSHYDGSAWQQVQQEAGNEYYVNDMQMVSASDGWAVGRTVTSSLSVLHLQNGHWDLTPLTGLHNPLLPNLNLSFASPADGWVVAGSSYSPSAALAYHYSAGSWQSVTLPITDFAAYAVYDLAPNDVWIGGSEGHLLHWNGNDWMSATLTLSNVYAIKMFSDTEGWVGGDNGLLHYTGGNWQAVDYGGGEVFSLSFIHPEDGFAGTSKGSIRYYAGCPDAFNDISYDYWAYHDIHNLTCKQVVNGTSYAVFSPHASASRSQFAKMITLALGWQLVIPVQPTFSDVLPTNILYSFVETAAAHRAITGASATACANHNLTSPCFLPNDPITRAQAAAIIVRAYGWPLDTSGGPHFSDVPPDYFAYPQIETCYNRNVINGIGGGLFAPNQSVTRDQIARMLNAAMQQP